jgi:hypothetical protein
MTDNNDALHRVAGGNTPAEDLEIVKRMQIREIMQMTAAQLMNLVRQADEEFNQAKMTRDWLHGILVEKYKDQSQNVRQQLGKDTGTIRMEEDGVMVVSNLPKKVEWDQKKLAEIIEKLTSEGWNIQQLARQEFKVSERQFNELPSGVRAMFEEARTIKVGKPSIKLEIPEEQEGA